MALLNILRKFIQSCIGLDQTWQKVRKLFAYSDVMACVWALPYRWKKLSFRAKMLERKVLDRWQVMTFYFGKGNKATARKGGGGNSLIKVRKDVRRVQNLARAENVSKSLIQGQKGAQKPNNRESFCEL